MRTRFNLIRFWSLRCWIVFSGLGISCVSCGRSDYEDIVDLDQDTLHLDDRLILFFVIISACITGQLDDGGIKKSYKKDFARAHRLFSTVAKMIGTYPKITKLPIAKRTLENIKERLSTLALAVKSLPSRPGQFQFMKEINQLATCISSLT